jgi:hypothetical protein
MIPDETQRGLIGDYMYSHQFKQPFNRRWTGLLDGVRPCILNFEPSSSPSSTPATGDYTSSPDQPAVV